MNSASILLVDDNEIHQYALGKHLQQSGYRVLHAKTGATTLEMAETQQPSAILLDINLPDMNGFEICERLKASSTTSEIPVIFHSATHDSTSAQSYAKVLGAVSFLTYPIDLNHLLSVLSAALVRNKAKSSKS